MHSCLDVQVSSKIFINEGRFSRLEHLSKRNLRQNYRNSFFRLTFNKGQNKLKPFC